MLFSGSMVAIITPFKDGRIDEDSFRKLIDWQISCGTDTIVVCGTTGEAATLTVTERERIVQIAVEEVSGRVPVMAGAGSNSTDDAIHLSHTLKKAGADGLLHVTPYYNKPTQEGLYQHFRAITEVIDLPVVLYNVPSRTGINMLAETSIRLSMIDSIVGVKEASGNMDQVREIVKNTPDEFGIYSGEDALNLKIYKAGGKGCISVTANIVPDKISTVWDKFIKGNIDEATEIQDYLQDLNDAMFLVTNPIPVKTSLALMGKCREEFRLPLTPMGDDERNQLESKLAKYNLT
ncbi:MAG: 4-hydroxy-tetrahydrodipicolinate synthase [Deltaproteobacteria bacterium]|jgi:4-hydroxy-tetrahydrodipicolinate synthase|nr:4-hydroxy-tetrahydrodipicolinate synthase [Deltaproteobacteria bacterium]